jgi:hypothetical protein
MTNITQILNVKKFASAKDNGLRIPIMSDIDQKEIIEYNLFKRINQSDQFYDEKKRCENFRFCGQINGVVNLKYIKGETFNIKPNINDFDVSNISNWITYLMAPLNNINGEKGDKIVKVSDNGITKTLNFKHGLPSLVIKPEIIGNRT